VTIKESEIPFLIEKTSSLLLDGKPYLSDNQVVVKDILYGIEYGKSSK
jgi:hypothetical protein